MAKLASVLMCLLVVAPVFAGGSSDQGNATNVSEPESIVLLAIGLAIIMAIRKK
jgi:hypothetical protein